MVEYREWPYNIRLWIAGWAEQLLDNVMNRLFALLIKDNLDECDLYIPRAYQHTSNISVLDWNESDNFEYVGRVENLNIYREVDKSFSDWMFIFDEGFDWKRKWVLITPGDCPIIWIKHKSLNIMWLIHSGWKSTAKWIIDNWFDILEERYWKEVFKDLILRISPFSKKCCYEFSHDLFKKAFIEWNLSETEIIDPLSKRHSEVHISKHLIHFEQWHKTLDIEWILRLSIGERWIPNENISISDICTIHQWHWIWYFSNRVGSREWDWSKRFWVWIFTK